MEVNKPVKACEEDKKINDTKSRLVSSRSTFKRLVITEKRYNLREQVESAGPSNGVVMQETNPPQIIFPNEVWLTIFEQMDNAKDLYNCYNTCHLFRHILKTMKTTLFLNKLLPLLLQPEYLKLQDILNLRLVSKIWREHVDSYMEEKRSWRIPRNAQLTRKVPIVDYVLKLQPTQMRHAVGKCTIKEDMYSHPRNPFLTRSLLILIEYYRENAEEHEKRIIATTKEFLTHCGKQIWYLTLKSEIGDSVYSNSRVYFAMDLVKLVLEHCPNLVELKLIGYFQPMYNQKVIEWHHVAQLTALSLTQAEGEIISDCIKNLHHQLKMLSINMEFEEQLFFRREWPVLTELHVQNINTPGVLERIGNLVAPKLKFLNLELVDDGCSQLKTLLQAIYHFPQLEDLVLSFRWDCRIDEDQIHYLPTTLPDICSVKRLTWNTGFEDKITYSLLAYFPYLEQLKISYGVFELWKRKESGDNSRRLGRWNWEFEDSKMYDITAEKRQVELVDIREYLYINRMHINKCNIWHILPFLREITICSTYNNSKKTQVFERE